MYVRAFLGLAFHFRKGGGRLGTVRRDFVVSVQDGDEGPQDGDSGLWLGDEGSVGGEVEDFCGGEVGEG